MTKSDYGEKRGPTVFERLRNRKRKSGLTAGQEVKATFRGPRDRVDGKPSYANAIQRRVESKKAKKSSGFRNMSDLVGNSGRSKRERNFAVSQRSEINKRFGGDINKALAAMRREAARQKARR